jgi:hypothetical protein
MNCKPGDLAVFVRSTCGNEGLIVRCIRLLTKEEMWERRLHPDTFPCWLTDTPTKCSWGKPDPSAPDAYIRPIRDPGEDARDETLEWLPVPSVKEPA